MTVVSTPGVGSIFSVSFVTDQQAEEAVGLDASDSIVQDIPGTDATAALLCESWETACAGKKVLLVDDDDDGRMLLSDYLAAFGCDVLTASTGQEGIGMAREQHPHLIILDLLMPEMNGWEVMQELSNDPEVRDIPVVVVSALAGNARVSSMGVVDFLTKPVGREQMARVLSRSLRPEHRRVLWSMTM